MPNDNQSADTLGTRFSCVESEAKRIMDLKKAYDNAAREELKSLARDDESAMIESIEQRANHHFVITVKPYFLKKFNSYGTKDKTRILKIEKSIRSTILDKIIEGKRAQLDIARAKKHTAIVKTLKDFFTFVAKNRNKLKAGRKIALDTARQWLLANDDVYQIAWRCYDKFSLTSGSNFITTTLDGRYPIRERAAYYYLAAIDELADDTPENKMARINDFIIYLAEIMRAHNDRCINGREIDDKEIDAPSCLEGCITRIANMGAKHPIARLPELNNEAIMQCMQSEVVKFFADRIKNLSNTESERLCLALVMLSDKNAGDVENPARLKQFTKDYPNTLLRIRKDFVLAFESSEYKSKVNKLLTDKILPIIEDFNIPQINYALANIGGFGSVAQSLSDCYLAHINANAKATANAKNRQQALEGNTKAGLHWQHTSNRKRLRDTEIVSDSEEELATATADAGPTAPARARRRR